MVAQPGGWRLYLTVQVSDLQGGPPPGGSMSSLEPVSSPCSAAGQESVASAAGAAGWAPGLRVPSPGSL